MRRLDLSENPLSDEGACALFRRILQGLPCFVIMRDCTLAIDSSLFNHVFPANASPYLLDLSKPYDAAILHELVLISLQYTACNFESITYTAPKGAQYNHLNLRDAELVLHYTSCQ